MEAEETTNESSRLVGGGGGQMEAEKMGIPNTRRAKPGHQRNCFITHMCWNAHGHETSFVCELRRIL